MKITVPTPAAKFGVGHALPGVADACTLMIEAHRNAMHEQLVLKAASVLQQPFAVGVVLQLLEDEHEASEHSDWLQALKTLEGSGILLRERPIVHGSGAGRRETYRRRSSGDADEWYAFASPLLRQESFKLMLTSQAKALVTDLHGRGRSQYRRVSIDVWH